jgi:hypothetical protein
MALSRKTTTFGAGKGFFTDETLVCAGSLMPTHRAMVVHKVPWYGKFWNWFKKVFTWRMLWLHKGK